MADIILNKPEAGTQAVFEAAGDSRIDLNFPTDQATLERSGNDLIFRFDDGSTVVLRDFYTAYTKDSMPDFVLSRAADIMAECGIADVSKVGIYGLTYKEDVDDVRESPTLQMLDSMRRHLAAGACRVYDPWVERDVAPNQVHSMDEFLDGLEMAIVMVGHSQVKGKPELFGDRVLLDTRDVMGSGGNVYKL